MNNEPNKDDLESEVFNKVWNAIKNWDIQRKDREGYANATGTDVMIILNALKEKVVEEKKTLSDKRRSNDETYNWTYRETDVRESLKRILNFIGVKFKSDGMLSQHFSKVDGRKLYDKLLEEFGKELI